MSADMNKKNALQYTISQTDSHILFRQTHGHEACGAEVFRELRARQGPGWTGKMASEPVAPPMAAENWEVMIKGNMGGTTTGACV